MWPCKQGIVGFGIGLAAMVSLRILASSGAPFWSAPKRFPPLCLYRICKIRFFLFTLVFSRSMILAYINYANHILWEEFFIYLYQVRPYNSPIYFLQLPKLLGMVMIHVVNQALPYRNFCCFHLLLLHFGSRLALPFQHMKLGSDFMPSYSLVASFAFEYFILKVKLIRSYLLSNPKW